MFKALHKQKTLKQPKQLVTLLDIPEEILRYISRYLVIEDVLNLSMTCKVLFNRLPGHLPKYLPEYVIEHKMLKGPKVDETGPRGYVKSGKSWQPSFYFDTAPFTSHIFMATISAYWNDQGWGHRKGSIYILLIRPQANSYKSTVVTKHYNLLGHAPHEFERVVKTLSVEDPIISMIQPGDYFRFMKNVGGGGGHKLEIKEFTMHTRGLRTASKMVSYRKNNNTLRQDQLEMNQCNKNSFANLVELFRKQDEKPEFYINLKEAGLMDLCKIYF